MQSRKATLTGVYLSEMAAAYSDYLKCVADFVFRRGNAERDELACALYRLLLYASDQISADAQDIYKLLLKWGMSGDQRAAYLDQRVNHLSDLMQKDLDCFRRKGEH